MVDYRNDFTEFQRRDIARIKTPSEWPNWPVLPLTRRSRLGPTTAILCEAGAFGAFRLYVGLNMFHLPEELPTEFETKSPEEIVKDGWEVD